MKILRTNISLGLSIIACGLFTWNFFFGEKTSNNRIAFVRSSEVIYNYLGMKEAQNRFQEKSQGWQSNIDTLQKEFQLAMSNYTAEAGKMDKKEKEEREQLLQKQQENLVNYTKTLNDKAKQEDQKMTDGVLNQINSFVEQYGKDHGYTVIFGTTLSGNVLYGDNT